MWKSAENCRFIPRIGNVDDRHTDRYYYKKKVQIPDAAFAKKNDNHN